jgi:hypothetical protein
VVSYFARPDLALLLRLRLDRLQVDLLLPPCPSFFATMPLVALHARSAAHLINEARSRLVLTHYLIEYKAFNINPLSAAC